LNKGRRNKPIGKKGKDVNSLMRYKNVSNLETYAQMLNFTHNLILKCKMIMTYHFHFYINKKLLRHTIGEDVEK
jgi:hypothetical protein